MLWYNEAREENDRMGWLPVGQAATAHTCGCSLRANYAAILFRLGWPIMPSSDCRGCQFSTIQVSAQTGHTHLVYENRPFCSWWSFKCCRVVYGRHLLPFATSARTNFTITIVPHHNVGFHPQLYFGRRSTVAASAVVLEVCHFRIWVVSVGVGIGSHSVLSLRSLASLPASLTRHQGIRGCAGYAFLVLP